MPIITETLDYNGFVEKVARLGLQGLVDEATSTITSFPLLVEERKHANGTRGIRKRIDDGFEAIGGWVCVKSGGVDWTKATESDLRIGVEVQVSGRSDLLAVDIIHLSESITKGRIDAGIVIVPDNTLSRYLTDRTPNLAAAIRHVRDRAEHLPIRILAFRHDGAGIALPKHRTNLGRLPADAEPFPEKGRKAAEHLPDDHDSK